MKQFITDAEWELLQSTKSKDVFNEILNRLHNMTIEAAMLQLPITMENVAKNAIQHQSVVKKFYEDNPTFTSHRSIVAQVIQSTEEANPGLPYEQIFNMAVPEITKRIENIALGSNLPLTLLKREDINTNINGEI